MEKETTRQKRNYLIEKIAEDCGCSGRQVRYVVYGRPGQPITRSGTVLEEKILVAYALRMEGEERLTETVRTRLSRYERRVGSGERSAAA